MSAFTGSALVDQLLRSSAFEWSALQSVISEFSVVAKPALCGIDLFHSEKIARIKAREVIELQLALSDEDWEYCFALAEGLRPVGPE